MIAIKDTYTKVTKSKEKCRGGGGRSLEEYHNNNQKFLKL